MKIMHTADWHLGCSLSGEKRFAEFDQVLDRLLEIITEKHVGAVLIAGDVFDTLLPPNQAQKQYYNFLVRAGNAGVRTLIVLAGNHDSPSFLEAPKALLEQIHVHVFARVPENPDDCVIPLRDANGNTVALVGAVPYLHERDVRKFVEGEGAAEQEKNTRSAVLGHFQQIVERMKRINAGVPRIVTGHLFMDDSKSGEEGCVGTLFGIPSKAFPSGIDYLALGHLHNAHDFTGTDGGLYRYSGSPAAISFSELDVPKTVTILDTEALRTPEEVEIPHFQEMRILKGSLPEMEETLKQWIAEKKSIWCHAVNTGSYVPGIQNTLNDLVKDSEVRVLTTRNAEQNPEILRRMPKDSKLEDLTPEEVFLKFLEGKEHPEETKELLLKAFREICGNLHEEESK